VNDHFAEITLQALRKMLKENPDQVPLVWIHDYHLMLAANTVRTVADEENLSCKIGFFLHIPFPPWDLLKIFPWEDMILQVYMTFIIGRVSRYRILSRRVFWAATLWASTSRTTA